MTTRITVTTGDGGLVERNAQQQAANRQGAVVRNNATKATAAGTERRRIDRIAAGRNPETGEPLIPPPSTTTLARLGSASTPGIPRLNQQIGASRFGFSPLFIFAPTTGPSISDGVISWPIKTFKIDRPVTFVQSSGTPEDLKHTSLGFTANRALGESRLTESIGSEASPAGGAGGSIGCSYTFNKAPAKKVKKIEITAEVRSCERVPNRNTITNDYEVGASSSLLFNGLLFAFQSFDSAALGQPPEQRLAFSIPSLSYSVIIGDVITSSFTPVKITIDNISSIAIQVGDGGYQFNLLGQSVQDYVANILVSSTHEVAASAGTAVFMSFNVPRVPLPSTEPGVRNLRVKTYLWPTPKP
jgi:hypothetical protein